MLQCLSLGADVNNEDKNRMTTLLYFATDKQSVDTLIARKANVNQVDSAGNFALYIAANVGKMDVCESLLKAGADKTLKLRGKTAAQRATERGFTELAAFIDAFGRAPSAPGQCACLRSCLITHCLQRLLSQPRPGRRQAVLRRQQHWPLLHQQRLKLRSRRLRFRPFRRSRLSPLSPSPLLKLLKKRLQSLKFP